MPYHFEQQLIAEVIIFPEFVIIFFLFFQLIRAQKMFGANGSEHNAKTACYADPPRSLAH